MDLENFPTREMAKDMMSMISPIYDDSYVGKWIFEVMSLPLALARQAVDEIKLEAFPETATWTLPYWEQAYGIETDESLTVEERRAAILQKRVSRNPINPYNIEKAISELYGGSAEVVENIAPYIFGVVIEPVADAAEFESIRALIDKIKPAHLIYTIGIAVSATIPVEYACLVKEYKVYKPDLSKYSAEDPLDSVAWYADENEDILTDIDGNIFVD